MGSVKSAAEEVKGAKFKIKMAQPTTESQPNQSDQRNNEPRDIPIQSRNNPRDIPVETENKPAPKPAREDWRGPWPHDNLGPKPRLVGGKLVKPKFIDY